MNKAAIIINPNLPLGILANAVACITSGLFVHGSNLVGPRIRGDKIMYIPITKIPILILTPGKKSLQELCKQAKSINLKYMAFTKEAQSTTDYNTYENAVSDLPIESVNLLGLGLVGSAKLVNSLIGNLPMLH